MLRADELRRLVHVATVAVAHGLLTDKFKTSIDHVAGSAAKINLMRRGRTRVPVKSIRQALGDATSARLTTTGFDILVPGHPTRRSTSTVLLT